MIVSERINDMRKPLDSQVSALYTSMNTLWMDKTAAIIAQVKETPDASVFLHTFQNHLAHIIHELEQRNIDGSLIDELMELALHIPTYSLTNTKPELKVVGE